MKVRRKPVVLEATEYFPGVEHEAITFKDGCPVIETLEGPMRVSVGDFIIKGITGEFYPCKAHVFFQIYDIVEAG